MLEEYNQNYPDLKNFERLVPSHYHCSICKAQGQHWVTHCPWSVDKEEE